ncbi:hypothetical protein WG907_01480 [Sphingobium sp. AN558]|uniref:hypothetical protein n=1 Tax=Sphingobium sp. AN558 TaxID=3133442 RepID=UPI0030BF1B1F
MRDEPEIEEILTEPDETLARNLRALDDFRKLIASGDISCVERRPDGSLKPVTKTALRAFLADHGMLLIVSRDQNLWQCIPHRPIPMNELLVKLGGRVAPGRLAVGRSHVTLPPDGRHPNAGNKIWTTSTIWKSDRSPAPGLFDYIYLCSRLSHPGNA